MQIDGLSKIAPEFDAMLIDQFGVIHDGRKLYPHALEVLLALRESRIPVVVISNSGKRAALNVKRLVAMGVPRDCFVDCVSSGEVAFQSLTQKQAFLIGKDGEDYGFDPIQFVPAERAEVMLILGSNAPKTSLEQYLKLLESIHLPAICCNPDRQMITAQGLQPAPGAIAALYESLGRQVTWIGKPYPQIYAHALKRLGEPRRVLCVGDSAEHDVAGGRAAGLTTLCLLQGVSEKLKATDLQPPPDYVMTDFRW